MREMNALRGAVAAVSIIASVVLIMVGFTDSAQAAAGDAAVSYSIVDKTPSPSPGPAPSTPSASPSASHDGNDGSVGDGDGKVIAPLHERGVRIVPGWLALFFVFGLFCVASGVLIIWRHQPE